MLCLPADRPLAHMDRLPAPSPSTTSPSAPAPADPPPRPATPARPSHIPLPPPAPFGTWSLTPSPSHRLEDPFAEPIPSPALQFYTAPSSPQVDLPAPASPPSSPPPPDQPALAPVPPHDPFTSADIAPDLSLDDQTFTTLEKIWLFCCSKASFHRVYIARALPSLLDQVAPAEAVEFVLPLLKSLATDFDEQVKVALAAELVPIIWWFFTHCRVVPEQSADPSAAATDLTTISVQAFTPILGTLLLSHDSLIGGAARYAVVHLLSRIKKVDDHISSNPILDDDDSEIVVGLFGQQERSLFQKEILQQVVIGMGKLDIVDEEDQPPEEPATWAPPHIAKDPTPHEDAHTLQPSPNKENINPYFPLYPPSTSSRSPTSSLGSTPSPSTDTTSISSPSTTSSSPIAEVSPSGGSPIHLSSDLSPTVPSIAMPRSVTPDKFSIVSTPKLTGRQPSPPPDASLGTPPSPREIKIGSGDYQQFSEFGGESSWNSVYEARRDEEMAYFADEDGDGQAAVGRLSSMSLMAAVTVSGSLSDETKEAFVKEVERVGKDPVSWVRREAAFALGALAKVVPDELVQCSLLPLFESLRLDSFSDVRHSALFALPALLARLSPTQRRTLAMQTIIPLSSDTSGDVRTGVLESLGEVLHTFHSDASGPPEELLHLFLGRPGDQQPREPRRVINQQFSFLLREPPDSQVSSLLDKPDPLEEFYKHPERPHICAFNYPAVAFTLGKERWEELRSVYLELSTSPDPKVRRTIAASLGEMANIIGRMHAEADLIPIWWSSIKYDETEVRLKAVECLGTFVKCLLPAFASDMIQGLEVIWDEGKFSCWREREAIARIIPGLLQTLGLSVSTALLGLLRRALEDGVAAVREVAVAALPEMWSILWSHPDVFSALQTDLRAFAYSDLHRRRMTFVACQQSLIRKILSESGMDDLFWSPIEKLAADPIIGVRIGIARLLGTIAGALHQDHERVSGRLYKLAEHLSRDDSHEVQAYVSSVLEHDAAPAVALIPPGPTDRPLRGTLTSTTFSRPPPAVLSQAA